MSFVRTAKVIDAAPGDDLSSPELDDHDWHEVPVPGDLHLALAAAGVIPHPHDEPGDEAFAWVEAREWWYRLILPAEPAVLPGERLRLVFEGVDTFATFWLDGRLLGGHSNMFRPVSFDVTALVRADRESLVTVRIARPLEQDAPARDQVRLMRKAQFSYGWDFAPRRPGIGLWQPVRLVRDTGAALRHVRFTTTSLTPSLADAQADIGIDRVDDRPLTAHVTLTAPDGTEIEVQTEVAGDRVVVPLSVPEPALWWTHDRGQPVLHDLMVTLRSGTDVLAEQHQRVGLRTVELDQFDDPDLPGSKVFRFRLNDEPFEVRGANWVPCDTAVGAVDPDRRAGLLALARDAGMNMLRVWGGGIYEGDAFYERCDELGVLVWQDLMFAGAAYPDDDPEWLADVAAEIAFQADRLTSHPCVGVWCGNNEVELLATVFDWGSASPAHRLFYEVAPEALGDTGLPYLPTSPFLGNGPDGGDRHNWQVWHGIDEGDPALRTGVGWVLDEREVDPQSAEAQAFANEARAERYLEDQARFVSEYGLGAAPTLETLTRYGVKDLDAARGRLRAPRLGPRNKLEILLADAVGLPTDLPSYVELSQLLQAEGVKTGAEHYRRRWPHCGGSMIWQLDDCWPSLSWAMVDVDLRPKALYHYARRFFSPVLASFAPTPDGCELWVSNSTTQPFTDALVVRAASFSGDVVDEVIVDVDVSAQTSAPVHSLRTPDDPRSTYVSVHSPAGRVRTNRHFFAALKDLERASGAPIVELASIDGDLVVTVTGTAYHLLVHAVPEDPRVVFDDNYVDLAPGETRVLSARGAAGTLVTVRSR
jgi:beta-mannosidase